MSQAKKTWNCALALKKYGWIAVSTIAVAIYARHPLHTEAVIPASGRAELLCALFVFAGLYFHTFSRRHFFANFAAGLCVLFSFWFKEDGIILIPICLVYDFFYHRRSREKFALGNFLSTYLIYMLFFIPSVLSRISDMGGFFPDMKHFDLLGESVFVLCVILIFVIREFSRGGKA